MMNSKLAEWFLSGHIADALAGIGGYFIPDVTWRDEHDVILVIGELALWADTPEKKRVATESFCAVIERCIEQRNLPKVLRLLLATKILEAENKRPFLADIGHVVSNTATLVQQCGIGISHDEELRNLVIHAAKWIPELITTPNQASEAIGASAPQPQR